MYSVENVPRLSALWDELNPKFCCAKNVLMVCSVGGEVLCDVIITTCDTVLVVTMVSVPFVTQSSILNSEFCHLRNGSQSNFLDSPLEV